MAIKMFLVHQDKHGGAWTEMQHVESWPGAQQQLARAVERMANPNVKVSSRIVHVSIVEVK